MPIHTSGRAHHGAMASLREGWTFGAVFDIEPKIRFAGQVGEQATFFLDPSRNALEFKAFGDMNQLFSTDD